MNRFGRTPQLELERQALDRIREAHLRYLERNRSVARGLAAEAAEAVDDGIRDIVDEDAEADAAVQAVLVRQMSERAMYAARRVADLEAQGDALAFGKVVEDGGDELYIGRRTVLDGDDVLLVDWRARAAVPFYRATPLEPMGLDRRRHLLYDDPRPETPSALIDYSDEVFDPARMISGRDQLRGEAALLASLDAPTREQMHTVVATIQAEQDAVIRAPADKTLVVQGGPGTGKTVVALHRAAYLLYDKRVELAETGVLIVGPSQQFLHYISQVLPSLGESGVVAVTLPRLYRGIRPGLDEPSEVADVKGSAAMASLVAAAVDQRQRPPNERLVCWYGSRRVVVDLDRLQRLFRRAGRHRHHNDGAAEFRRLLIDTLAGEVHDRSFHDLEEARRSFAANPDVQEFLLAHFPPLSPEQALNDVLGSKSLLRSALVAAGHPPSWVRLLFRRRTPERELDRRIWSEADAALLDEFLALLGPVGFGSGSVDGLPAEEPSLDRHEDDDVSLIDGGSAVHDGGLDGGVSTRPRLRSEPSIEPFQRPDDADDTPFLYQLDDPYIDDDDEYVSDGARSRSGPVAIVHHDIEVPYEVAFADTEEVGPATEDGRAAPESDGSPAEDLTLEAVDAAQEVSATVQELAALERSWQFGHVIVDEAQDLTAMQWRMVARRAEAGITIVGDLAQRKAGTVNGWDELLPPMLADISFRELTINYRSPRELDPLAHRLLAELAPGLTPARSIRPSGHEVVVERLDGGIDVAASVTGVLKRELDRLPRGRVCLIAADPELNAQVADRVPGVHAMTPTAVKGLEFDVVVVVEPALIVAQAGGLGLLYVAVTRPTQRLVVAHSQPLPEVMVDVLDRYSATSARPRTRRPATTARQPVPQR